MNDESDNLTPHDVGKLLDDVVPTPPPTTGWAATASGRVRRRRWLTGATAALALAVALPAGVWLSQDGPMEAVPQPADSRPVPGGTPSDPPSADGPVEVVGNASVYQYADEEQPHLCVGMVASSLPPQCGGPTLVGDFSWDGVQHEGEDSSTRWTNEQFRFHGYLEFDGDSRGTFTMSRPFEPASDGGGLSMSADFPQLCDDMLVDADASRAGWDDQNRLKAALENLPLVGMWVSDGSDAFNVLVQGDAEATFQQLRNVWGGELCVQSSDSPTEAERSAAVTRVWEAVPQGVVLFGSQGSGIDPTIEVQLLVATPEFDAAVRDAVGDMEVRITAVFNPVESPDTPGTPAATDPPSQEPGEVPTDTLSPDFVMAEHLVGDVVLFKSAADEHPRLYYCEVPPFFAKSRAPDLTPSQCDGATVKGDVSWSDVAEHPQSPSRYSDRLWSMPGHRVVGHLDPFDGSHGTFTLSEPVTHVGPARPGTLAPEDVSPTAATAPADQALNAVAAQLWEALESTGLAVRVEVGTDGNAGSVIVRVVVIDESVTAALDSVDTGDVPVVVEAVFSSR